MSQVDQLGHVWSNSRQFSLRGGVGEVLRWRINKTPDGIMCYRAQRMKAVDQE